MANVKISELTALTTPSGNEEMVFANNGSNGKVTLNTIKTFVNPSGAYVYKGTVLTFNDLPSAGMNIGDVYNVESEFDIGGDIYPAGTNVAWNGTSWDPLGGMVDFSQFLSKTNTTPYTPIGDYNPATKLYVDSHVSMPQVMDQDTYDDLPSSKNTDGIIRFIFTEEA